MISGKTSCGFEYEIQDEALNNWELIEDLAQIETGDIGACIRSLRKLLGNDQTEALKNHLRDPETGIVKLTDMMLAQQEIMTGHIDTKNS